MIEPNPVVAEGGLVVLDAALLLMMNRSALAVC